MKEIRTVTFDVGSTLVHCDPPPQEIYAGALSKLGRPVTADEVGPVFSEAWAAMQRRTQPGRDRYSSVGGDEKAWWGEFLREILDRLDHDAPWQHLLDDLYAAFAQEEVWRLYPDSVPTLEALRARGFQLGVISNWDRRLPEILRSLDIDRFFDVITVSAIAGLEKPASGIFSRTLEELGATPETTLHVGDSPREDYGGALAAGLQAVLIDRRALFDDETYQRITDLEQILDLVNGDESCTMR